LLALGFLLSCSLAGGLLLALRLFLPGDTLSLALALQILSLDLSLVLFLHPPLVLWLAPLVVCCALCSLSRCLVLSCLYLTTVSGEALLLSNH